ncbi:MAG TPA: hypothetical protein VGX76_01735 [Pirellulales bacterium]|jgi:hypothetical protein|nr:hypothetical protein [Pirellulales bacterium]
MHRFMGIALLSYAALCWIWVQGVNAGADDGAAPADSSIGAPSSQPQSDQPSSGGPQSAANSVAPFRLMSAERDALYRQFLPAVDDAVIGELLADPRLVLYTEREMPKAYQFWDGAFPGVHSARYNISANGSEPFGNGNREFPWASPAGTHRTPSVTSLRFFRLPQDGDGRVFCVAWYRKRGGGDASGYSWVFPVGTFFGEVLLLKGPHGHDYTFELRIRRRETGHWQVDVFRPFPTSAALAARIKVLRPAWQDEQQLAALCQHLDEPRKLESQTLADRQPHRRVFRQTMGVDSLPPVGDDGLVEELLTGTVFRSALGATWRDDDDGVETCAPTTLAAFHVVPANYDAGFIAVDDASCMRCHETANAPVREFNYGRDWYGRVRGSDGIFSFHPFSLDSISDNGYARTVRMRREFEQAGLLEPYDPGRHPSSIYQTLLNSRE